MTSKIFVIMGATGQIGHVLAKQLLKNGHKVRALGRDQNKLGELKSLGAEVITIEDFTDATALTKAFNHADAVFSFIPPGYMTDDISAYQDKVGEAIKTAIQKNHIPYVVNLSSIGGQLSAGGGPINGLHRHEERLNTLKDVNILHLRPGYFMENLFWSIPSIKHTGHLSTASKSDLMIPMIATKDIALTAAERLNRLDFEGHSVFEMVGPHAHTMVETAKILGKAIGQPHLSFVQLSMAEAEKEMVASGMRPKNVKLMLEMYQSFNENKIHPTQKIDSAHKTKTTLEEFAGAFAQAFKHEVAHTH